MPETRRNFLASAAALAAVGTTAKSAAPPLPTIRLGKYEILV
jgi:hypothetical protein